MSKLWGADEAPRCRRQECGAQNLVDALRSTEPSGLDQVSLLSICFMFGHTYKDHWIQT